ncbi:cytochrome c biogenesis heme-transporting ATPase CcmA [Derxia gummosa]|uniref:Cytochrome c biogenesis heme-transporting ATPase CcmA n=1 Tax=Derxia gummosa DSM 723 TaxID=1121388 RepID=A0A8B6X7V0_9BURK|nr:cytochrome c biogenesis heme-transporting ATPase CcmA [Derxia gummosa]
MTLEASNLACERGGRELFAGLDFTVGAGEALWVRGPNGAGKSSLLRILCGLSAPAAGELRWRGSLVHKLREDFRRELLFIGHAAGLKDELTASENLGFAAMLAGRPVNWQSVADALAQAGLSRIARVPAGRLSQGQRRRVSLARLFLARDARLIVLDEPFAALDAAAIEALVATLDARLAEGASLVFTTHQPQTLAARRLQSLELDAWRPRVARP